MIHNERTQDVGASAEVVWQMLAAFMDIGSFHPRIASVDALTEGAAGVGTRRRCHFKDGSSVVEEVTAWEPGSSYRVRLSEYAMPLKQAFAEFTVTPTGENTCGVSMAMDYQVKFGPVGWLMGQTAIRSATSKVFGVVLGGLAEAAEKRALAPAR